MESSVLFKSSLDPTGGKERKKSQVLRKGVREGLRVPRFERGPLRIGVGVERQDFTRLFLSPDHPPVEGAAG